MAMPRVAIDPNVRVRGGKTYAGFEDIDGDAAVGEVAVHVPETSLTGTGRIVEVDDLRQLVVLDVDWASIRPGYWTPEACIEIEPQGFAQLIADLERPRELSESVKARSAAVLAERGRPVFVESSDHLGIVKHGDLTLRFDHEGGCLYVETSTVRESARQMCIPAEGVPKVIVDYDADDNVIGVEVLR